MECSKLWVYGSLLSGFFNYKRVLAGKVLTCTPAKVRGILFHQIDKGYPAIVEGDDWIYGELLELEGFFHVLPKIDMLENYFGLGNDNEYDRIPSQVFVYVQGEWMAQQAYVYWYAQNDLGKSENPAVRVLGGDWRSYMLNQPSNYHATKVPFTL
ncbi:MAG: gamma-glutamylcyclotransferase [Sphaerochaeta sp.]|nr:gamma-glutamylcyclotransferase [Sphaerochaeta sp.]